MIIGPVFNDNLEIGKFYSVPTAHGVFGHRYDDWPVLGPMHDDKEVIGFEYVHYHFDFRFFNSYQWDYALRYTMGVLHKIVMHEHPAFPSTKPGPIIFRRRKCHREYPVFPFEMVQSSWLPKLKQAYKAAVMKDLICPHKGASLRGLPVDKSGCVTCPLHGLRFNVITGQMAEQPEGAAAGT